MGVHLPYRPSPLFQGFAGPPYSDRVEPASFPDHILRYRNQTWADKVGLNGLSDDQWLDHFGRFAPLPDNLEKPLALRYHGHQFQQYNSDIGDGRGFLFAQLRDDQNRLLDLGTKGSGQTPYSRFGDGRLTLKGGVREILATQMLEALGVYTSKSFSLIETGEALTRNDEPSPTRSAVLVRLSHSHIRFGAFQRLAFEKNVDAIAALVEYCIEHFYPHLESQNAEARQLGFFQTVVSQTAKLAAQWMNAGFVHGVLNTDNMNVTGESFDYGPWRFAPTANAHFTAAYFDQTNLYAFGRQSGALAWNLARLGDCLTHLIEVDDLNECLQSYSPAYERAMCDALFQRLGLQRAGTDDSRFVADWFTWLAESQVPFEQAFFDWFGGTASSERAANSPASAFYKREDFQRVREQLLGFTPIGQERLTHEYFNAPSPCTMLIDEVEEIWDAIAQNDNWEIFESKLQAITGMGAAYGFAASDFSPETTSSLPESPSEA